jgi:hypothetical protein
MSRMVISGLMTNRFGAGKAHLAEGGGLMGLLRTTKMPPDSQSSLPKNAFRVYVDENAVEL